MQAFDAPTVLRPPQDSAARGGRGVRAVLTALLVCLLTGAAAAPALASKTQQAIFQDDDLLIYNTPQGTAQTLDTLQALGVKSIRVSVFWRLIAPDALSTTRPANFNAGDPAAYPSGSWARYDQVIADAQARGISVNLDITSPAPLWATQTPDRADIAATYRPSPAEFAAFVAAVGTRYSGLYAEPVAPPPPPPPPPPVQQPNLLQLLLGINPNGSGSTAPPTPAPVVAPATILPRVSSWSIWNEPNQAGWLTPQWAPNSHGTLVATAPALYRSLVDVAYAELKATDHANDTILIGETAPKGLSVKGETRAIKPLLFIQDLYCLSSKFKPLSGAAAANLGCPTTAAASRRFVAANPGLFQASGFAHHPYELTFGPSVKLKDPQYITIANLSRLTNVLDAAQRAYHRSRRLPLYLTEFGYMTNPPSDAGVTLTQQSAYLNQAEFIAYSNSRVRDLSQFLLVDSPLIPCVHCSNPGSFGSSFETGLEFGGGKAKPSFAAFRMPIYLPVQTVKRGAPLRVWGMVRPAPGGAAQKVSIQFRPGRSGAFKRLVTARTRSHPAYLDTHIRLKRSGQVRISWRNPATHAVYSSRTVSVTVR
jgi:hypothetical protein